MKRRYHTLTFPLSEAREVPEGIMSLGGKRTLHLHRLLAYRNPADLLANAYVQGMTDALETVEKLCLAASHDGASFTRPQSGASENT